MDGYEQSGTAPDCNVNGWAKCSRAVMDYTLVGLGFVLWSECQGQGIYTKAAWESLTLVAMVRSYEGAACNATA